MLNLDKLDQGNSVRLEWIVVEDDVIEVIYQTRMENKIKCNTPQMLTTLVQKWGGIH